MRDWGENVREGKKKKRKRTVVLSVWMHCFLERLLGVSLAPDILESNKWPIFKDGEEMIGSLHHSIKHRILLIYYKSQKKPKMVYCCHVWAGAVQFQSISIGAVVKRPCRQRKNCENDGIIRCTIENNRWFESNLLSARNPYFVFGLSAIASIFTLIPSYDARIDLGY